MSPFDRDLHLRSALSRVHYIDFSVKIFSEVIQATQTTKLLISFILAQSPDTFYYHHTLTVILLETFLLIRPITKQSGDKKHLYPLRVMQT